MLIGRKIGKAHARRGAAMLNRCDTLRREADQVALHGLRDHAHVLQAGKTASLKLGVDRRDRIALADKLDLHVSPVCNRDRQIDVRCRLAPIPHLAEINALEPEKRPHVHDLRPMLERRVEIRYDKAVLHDRPEVVLHECSR